MKRRSREDFSGVITDLPLNRDIVPVSSKFTNFAGVYYNSKSKEGFQYAVAFATIDEEGNTWIETFGVDKDDTKMTVRGGWGGKHMGKSPSGDDIKLHASAMIEQHLSSE